MKGSTADTRRQPASAGQEGVDASAAGGAGLAPVLALTVTLAFGAFLALMGLVLLVNHPVPIPGLPLEQNQDAETLLYVAAFALILPLALLAGPRLADRIAAGPNSAALDVLTGLLAASLAAVILSVKASALLPWGDGVGVALAAAALWWAVAALAIWRAAQPRAWGALLAVSGIAFTIWALTGALAVGLLLCLTDLGSVSPVGLLLGAAIAAAVFFGLDRVRPPTLGRPWRIAIDVVLLVLLVLAVPDLLVATPEDAPGNLAVSLETAIIQFHQNFLLGPANDVLAGRAVLVDTASQYGVGSIYLLAGWFELAPIGYGTLGLLSGILSALVFAAGYCVLRMAGASRLLAAGAMVVAVVALIFNPTYPIDSIPQDSSLRFGLPIAVIFTLVAAQRWPRHEAAAWAGALAVAGLASIWSFEAFVYTLATMAAMAAAQSMLRPAGDRLGWLGGRAIRVAAACLCAHLLLALITLAAAGELPDWGQYLAYIRAFLFESLGDLNYDFAPWSPGLAVGAGYLASAAAIVLLVLRRPSFVQAQSTTIVALAGTTAYGAAIFSYFDNRSTDFSLVGVALPALLTGALWLSLVLRSRGAVTERARRGALAFALSLAVLLVAVGWSAIGDRYPRSALAHSLPGGKSLRGALDRLWNMPALNSRAPEGERLLERYMPGEQRSLLLLTPDVGTEILIRSGRANTLPIAAPWQDSFVASERLPGLRRAVEELRPGQRMLLDEPARKAFAAFRANPSLDPLAREPTGAGFELVPVELAPLQTWALKRIGERFDLRTVARGEYGLTVVELVPRR